MVQPKLLGPAEVRENLESGGTLLVCAYSDDAMFEEAALHGAIPFSEFQARRASLPRDLQIVFY